MGQRRQKRHHSTTTPSSPTHSSSSSDFEFTISVSPRKSSAAFCPADELFYKGQLLPLHLSPRLSMVRTLLLSSSSTSSSDTTTTASRDSTASSTSVDCDSSGRSSSATDDEFKRLTTTTTTSLSHHQPRSSSKPPSKYFSLPKLSSVFRPKEHKTAAAAAPTSSVRRVSSTAKEVIRKYLKKVKPLYGKLSQKHQKISPPPPPAESRIYTSLYHKDHNNNYQTDNISHSFSGNLRYPMRGSGSRSAIISSCPSSMGSSPSHGKSGFRHGYGYGSGYPQTGRATCNSDMEELQSAIQGAIAHCKNSMMKNKTTVSNEI